MVTYTINKNVLVIKPMRCTNFSKLFLEQNSACFGQFLCPPSGVQHCTHSCRYSTCHTGYVDCLLASSQHNLYVLLCVQCQTPDDGQRYCPKHTEFYSKNKFEKLVHPVGFIIRIYHDGPSPERQKVVKIVGLSQVKYFPRLQIVQMPVRSTHPPIKLTMGFIPRVKRPNHEFDH